VAVAASASSGGAGGLPAGAGEPARADDTMGDGDTEAGDGGGHGTEGGRCAGLAKTEGGGAIMVTGGGGKRPSTSGEASGDGVRECEGGGAGVAEADVLGGPPSARCEWWW